MPTLQQKDFFKNYTTLLEKIEHFKEDGDSWDNVTERLESARMMSGTIGDSTFGLGAFGLLFLVSLSLDPSQLNGATSSDIVILLWIVFLTPILLLIGSRYSSKHYDATTLLEIHKNSPMLQKHMGPELASVLVESYQKKIK